eukprot:TRINITY_DN16740_c0_g1_i1.p1 TRINITY_DN16740_c0_g1~~TRINITY_DN16740_c0_g1_i1.p1  ORF type:complete len:385 (+),score=21.97 TRINITY_DN16740_c0_g1_i1:858-2012(+)
MMRRRRGRGDKTLQEILSLPLSSSLFQLTILIRISLHFSPLLLLLSLPLSFSPSLSPLPSLAKKGRKRRRGGEGEEEERGEGEKWREILIRIVSWKREEERGRERISWRVLSPLPLLLLIMRSLLFLSVLAVVAVSVSAAPTWWTLDSKVEIPGLLTGPVGGPANLAFDNTGQYVGPKGPIGPDGPPGPSASDGAPGEPGLNGPNGAIGPVGAPGNPGADGAPGAHYCTNCKGPWGEKGVSVSTHGAKGQKGLTGPSTSSATPGAQGATGPPGPKGFGGVQGVNGDTIGFGGKGLKGLRGAAGPTGPVGAYTGPTFTGCDAMGLACILVYGDGKPLAGDGSQNQASFQSALGQNCPPTFQHRIQGSAGVKINTNFWMCCNFPSA